MIYLDYSATTPVNPSVLESFVSISKDFLGNANSIHKLGVKSQKLITASSNQIAKILNILPEEIIYTSGASEANNLAIKGICLQHQNRGKHIISTSYEHSSVKEVLKYLETLGFEVTYVKGNQNGIIEIAELKRHIRKDTILITMNAINSEIGLQQNILEIARFLKENYQLFFHVDLTQSMGKIAIDLKDIDLASFSAHKIYGLLGVGCLIKKKKITLCPLIHGGKSTTDFRSGTPAHALIASLAKSLRLVTNDLEKKYEYVQQLNNYLRTELQKFSHVYINSNEYCIPHILNISIKGVKAETFLHALEEYDVFVSTKSACSDENSLSTSVLELTNDIERAKSSIRISLSYLTTKEELTEFLNIFSLCYQKYVLKD